MAKLILIIDDDPDIGQTMADVLELEGYRTLVATNGMDALDQLARGARPDLILLDMMMPVMDGWAFRAEQQKLDGAANIPVLTVTADGDAKGKAQAIRAAGHVAKPVSVDALLDAMEHAFAAGRG
jgi:CheY-like chemotaxis protein